MATAISILLVIFFLFMNAFFVMAEFSLHAGRAALSWKEMP